MGDRLGILGAVGLLFSLTPMKILFLWRTVHVENVYGHTMLKAHVLFRTHKLNSIGPSKVSTWMGDPLGILGAVDLNFLSVRE